MIKKLIIVIGLLIATLGVSNAQSWFGGNNYNAIMRRGLLDYKKGKFDEALLKYNSVYNFKKNDPVANYNLGTILYKRGNFDTASYFFDNAVKYVQDPMLKSKAYYNMGNAYLQQKKYDKAVESFVNSLKYNPSDEDSRYNLSYALKNQQQQKQQQQQQQKNQPQQEQPEQKQQPKMDQTKAHELINSLNNKEQEQNKKRRGQGGNIKSKDW